jgi:hypothetical protein
MMKHETLLSNLSFLEDNQELISSYGLVRSRSSLMFRGMKIKVVKWPYFVMEIDHP